jgi:ABC-type transport system involved in multi-copper enzyme maturation permease subunit
VNYQKQINQYNADVMYNEKEMNEARNYSFLNPRAIQRPLVFSIYNQGFKFPRVINIIFYEPITNSRSLNEESYLLYYESTQIDITFFITFFLSLFILLISYDSINGEKRTGTLRVLMTYPIKRQSFILKKILGVFIFVSVAFLIPYILSIFSLVIIYTNILSFSFFLSAFFYGFLVLLYIFFFSLLGIFISCCSSNPNRSLVYSLLVWMMLAIILPTCWEYIVSPSLYNEKINQLTTIFNDKIDNGKRIFYQQVPDEANINLVGHMNWSGYFYDCTMWVFNFTLEQHIRFYNYVYENYYPASRETEQAKDDILRLQIHIDNTKSWVFFYNPIVLFTDLSAKITGNSRADFFKFIQDSRVVRDNLVSIGITDGWLLDYRFNAAYKEEFLLGDEREFWRFVFSQSGIPESKWDETDWTDKIDWWGIITEYQEKAEKYELTLPTFGRYNQPQHSLSEIFLKILPFLSVFVLSIVALWIGTWTLFNRYDVR